MLVQCKVFLVDRKRVQDWCEHKEDLMTAGRSTKRLLVAQVYTLALQGNPICKNKRTFTYWRAKGYNTDDLYIGSALKPWAFIRGSTVPVSSNNVLYTNIITTKSTIKSWTQYCLLLRTSYNLPFVCYSVDYEFPIAIDMQDLAAGA